MKPMLALIGSGELGALGTGNDQDGALVDDLAGAGINLGNEAAPLRCEQTDIKFLQMTHGTDHLAKRYWPRGDPPASSVATVGSAAEAGATWRADGGFPPWGRTGETRQVTGFFLLGR
jgi:hypothetical protein